MIGTDVLISSLVTLIAAILGSSGLWTYLKFRDRQREATFQLIMGLAHHRIIELGTKYADRGWVSQDEYQEFTEFIYGPYKKINGNGLAMRMAEKVSLLPFEPPEKR